MTIVREAWNIPELGAHALSPFRIQVAPRQTTTRRKLSHSPRHVVDTQLSAFMPDLKAGAPDAQVARRAGLTPSQVKHARLRYGIHRSPGRQASWRRYRALELVADFELVAHPVASPVDGGWEIPEYIVRTPLKYEALLQVVRAAVDGGMSADEVASGLGIRLQDVQHADALASRA